MMLSTQSKKTKSSKTMRRSEVLMALPEIPLELQIEIIVNRLPVKSLVRFKCLSKFWYSFISSFISSKGYLFQSPPRLFISLPQNHSNCVSRRYVCHNPVTVLLSSSSTSRKSSTVAFDLDITIQGLGGGNVASLRGLILYAGCLSKPCIYNPTTGQIVALPAIKFHLFPGYYRGPHNYFLGYDPVLDQYKVVCTMVLFSKNHPRRVSGMHWVYVLEAGGSWNRIEFNQPHACTAPSSSLCINGVIYYVSLCYSVRRKYNVISFNVFFEEFNIIQLPPAVAQYPVSESWGLGLIDYGGKPCLFDYKHLRLSGLVNLWVLEDAEKWSRMSLVLQPCQLHLVPDNTFLKVIGTTQSGEVVLQPGNMSSPYYILYYDLHKIDLRRVDIRGISDHELTTPDVTVPSLALMDTENLKLGFFSEKIRTSKGKDLMMLSTQSKKTKKSSKRMRRSEVLMAVPEIPLDLQIEIMNRLPVKSLVRFKCVSKFWYSFISSKGYLFPSPPRLFISLPQNHSNCVLRGYVCQNPVTPVLLSLSSTSKKSSTASFDLDITNQGMGGGDMASLRGLILYSDFLSQPCIYNPTTGQTVVLPSINLNFFSGKEGYDTGRLNYFLGYDPVLDQYKVVCTMAKILKNPRRASGMHWVYVLEAGGYWKRNEFNQPHACTAPASSLCINGVIYYLSFCFGVRKDNLISFNVKSEEFNIIQLPPAVSEYPAEYPLSETLGLGLIDYGGKPCLFDYKHLGSSGLVNLWVLEDAEKWSRTSLVLQSCQLHLVPNNTFLKVIGTTQNGEIVLQPGMMSSPYYILYYDLNKNDLRRVDIRGISDHELTPEDVTVSRLALMDTESIVHLEI